MKNRKNMFQFYISAIITLLMHNFSVCVMRFNST